MPVLKMTGPLIESKTILAIKEAVEKGGLSLRDAKSLICFVSDGNATTIDINEGKVQDFSLAMRKYGLTVDRV